MQCLYFSSVFVQSIVKQSIVKSNGNIMDKNPINEGKSGSAAAPSIGSETGSRRRKQFVPRKNCQAADNTWDDDGVPFFEEQEWQQRKTCCGVIYEGIALPGAVLIDSSQFKGCAEHNKELPPNTSTADADDN